MKFKLLVRAVVCGLSLLLGSPVLAGGRGGGYSTSSGFGGYGSSSYGSSRSSGFSSYKGSSFGGSSGYKAPSLGTYKAPSLGTYKAPSLSTYKAPSLGAYSSGGTRYKVGEYYKTTGLPKVERSETSRQQFLKSKGYSRVPSGYEVDHVVPLSKGGSDTPANMQVLSKEQHQAKTASERGSSR